jgi:hypothetical protein
MWAYDSGLTSFLLIRSPIFFILYGLKITRWLFRIKITVDNFKKGKFEKMFNSQCIFIFHSPKNLLTSTEDCSIASINAINYAHTFGIGSCFSDFCVNSINLNKSLKKDLKIPNGHKIYSVLFMGYPKYVFKREAARYDSKINIL